MSAKNTPLFLCSVFLQRRLISVAHAVPLNFAALKFSSATSSGVNLLSASVDENLHCIIGTEPLKRIGSG